MTDGTQSGQRLQLTFCRTGGFAGTTLSTEVDSESGDADAEVVRAALDDVDLDALPTASVPTTAADAFTYKMEITWQNCRHVLVYSEQALPDALRPLVRLLTARAKRR